MKVRDRTRNDLPLAASTLARRLYLVAGSVALGLGGLGLFLPVLPTTPLVLLAAACYARGSPRFHAWLLANRTFGPLIEEWQRHRAIPYRTKLIAIAMMSATLSASIVCFVRPIGLKLLLAACGLALASWMWRIPSRDRPMRA